MKIPKIILLITISLISLSSFSQSLTNKSIEELEIMKKEAISSENFELANKISEEQKSRVSLDDKIKELDKDLKIAVANENFDEAEKLKKEINKLEDKKVTINRLEEEKKAAILIEDFDKVIVLDKQISDLKSNRKPEPVTTNQSTIQTNPDTGNAMNKVLSVKAPYKSPYSSPTSNSTSIIFPTELSPNGDGINDFLVFENLNTYEYNVLYVKTKNQALVYMKGSYQNDWAGKTKLKTGEYRYILHVRLPVGGKKRVENIEGTFNYISPQ